MNAITTPEASALATIAPAQHDRAKYLGGSDIAAVLGISPWKTPLQLWQDKTMPAMPENHDPERLKVLNRGKRLEPYILDMIRAEHGLQITAVNQRYIDASVPYFASEIDAEAGPLNIEIKTVSPFKIKEWGEEGTDALPLHYVAQVQWGMGITGREQCDVFALIGDDLRRYSVLADDDLIVAMRDKAQAFWRQHVLTLNPPPPAGEADLYALYPRDTGQSVAIDGDDAAVTALCDLRALKDDAKSIAEKIAAAEGVLKARMADSAIATLGGQRVCSWKSQSARRFDQKAFAAAQPDLFDQFIKTTESRVFRLA